MKSSNQIKLRLTILLSLISSFQTVIFSGVLIIFSSFFLYQSSFIETAVLLTFTFFITLFINILGCNFIVTKIFQPFEDIQRGSRFLALGYFDYRIKAKNNDEMGELSNSFNMMASVVGNAFQKLRTDNQVISSERNKLKIIISQINSPIIATDLNRNIVIFNRAAQKLTGYSESVILHQPIEKMIHFFDEQHELNPETYCPIKRDDFEGVLFTKDGLKMVGFKNKVSYVNMISSKIAESENVNLGCILILKDVGEQKQLEQMKLDFVSMAAHDLRTPLTVIKGYLALIFKEYGSNLQPGVNRYLTNINFAAQELVALIEQLLDISGIEKGVLVLHSKTVDFRLTIQNTLTQVVNQANDNNIKLLFNTDNKPILINIDEPKIKLVLINLLENAIYYNKPNGQVTVWLETKGNNLITHIQDTGKGMSADDIDHLFTKFFRVSKGFVQVSKGLGLGLYISKSIIKLHKGDIWVESELGKGSTFSFSLPR